jgi:hypothetical protein
MSSMSCMNVPSLRGRHDRSNLMRRIGTLDDADEKDVRRYFFLLRLYFFAPLREIHRIGTRMNADGIKQIPVFVSAFGCATRS